MRRQVATLAAAATLLLVTIAPATAGGPFAEPRAGTGALAASFLRRQAATPDRADPSGRWIVMYKAGTDAARVSARQERLVGFVADRTFSHALHGFTARLDARQVRALRTDPTVQAIVPDERIQLAAQINPTGILRTNARRSAVARIDGIDDRVDADVAIVDTGIAPVPDLNVVGGYDCSSSNPSLWRDVEGHGTHVAGIVGAIDDGAGVVGMAPGVRLWAVKVLNDSGAGLLSWWVCGLDWIAAQRDPVDPSRPLFEAANMSVTKWGHDDGACGSQNADILHASICRLVSSGVTVVVAAANDSGDAALRIPASYDEVITVSALADTDGKPGGLGGNRCFSWGTWDKDDTFADFSNYGPDIDLIAPGKCIWSTIPTGYRYMSGTSMAAPHVTGAVALLKASRPGLSPAEVKEALQYLGTLNWSTRTDPDQFHERLLDVTRIGPRGDFTVAVDGPVTIPAGGGTGHLAVTLTRSPTSFERVVLRGDNLPRGVRVAFDRGSLFGFDAVASTMTVTTAAGVPADTYQVLVVGVEHGIAHTASATIVVAGSGAATDRVIGRRFVSSH